MPEINNVVKSIVDLCTTNIKTYLGQTKTKLTNESAIDIVNRFKERIYSIDESGGIKNIPYRLQPGPIKYSIKSSSVMIDRGYITVNDVLNTKWEEYLGALEELGFGIGRYEENNLNTAKLYKEIELPEWSATQKVFDVENYVKQKNGKYYLRLNIAVMTKMPAMFDDLIIISTYFDQHKLYQDLSVILKIAATRPIDKVHELILSIFPDMDMQRLNQQANIHNYTSEFFDSIISVIYKLFIFGTVKHSFYETIMFNNRQEAKRVASEPDLWDQKYDPRMERLSLEPIFME
jgi:hypothetical protein